MLVPIRHESGLPVYSRKDVDLFGFPDHYGVWEYLLVDDVVETQVSFGMYTHLSECNKKGKERPIHRYDRMERFKNVVSNLCGINSVPEEVLELVYDYKRCDDNDLLWEYFYSVLVKNGKAKYVNRLGYILEYHGYPKILSKIGDMFGVLESFDYMCSRFTVMTGKKYFPPLRYCALRLMKMHGYKFSYPITLVRTPCKVGQMDDYFVYLMG